MYVYKSMFTILQTQNHPLNSESSSQQTVIYMVKLTSLPLRAMPLASTHETTNRLPDSALDAPFTGVDATGVDGALFWSIFGSSTDTVGVLGSGAQARAGEGEGDATDAETGLDVGGCVGGCGTGDGAATGVVG
jgi:hypothetical protein